MSNFYANPRKARETVEGIRNGYYEVIRPLMLEQSPRATYEFSRLMFTLVDCGLGLNLLLYHSGMQFMATASCTLKDLEKGRFPSESEREGLEVSLAQLALAIKSGNSQFLTEED